MDDGAKAAEGAGMAGAKLRRAAGLQETRYRSGSAALGLLALVSSAHSGPQTPLAAGRMGLEGRLPRLPACLLALGSSALANWGRGLRTEDSPVPFKLLGLSYLFLALSRFKSSHYFELYSLLLPWLGSPAPVHEVSIKPSDKQLSFTSSEALPQDTSGEC